MNYHPLPLMQVLALAQTLDEFVLLESGKADIHNTTSYFFYDPVQRFSLRPGDKLEETFYAIEEISRKCFTAGYLNYELGGQLEKTGTDNSPLGLMTAYKSCITFDHVGGTFGGNALLPGGPVFEMQTDNVENLIPQISEKDYTGSVLRIREYIQAGDTYQVNFTFPYTFEFSGCPLSLYATLANSQPVPYQALIRVGGTHILSFSPELFFSRAGLTVYTRPMKGTARRGRTNREDELQERFLKTDPKNRAENTMIIDLLRNDLGRVCRVGSVSVCEPYTVEKYRTLFQMTSGVKGVLRDDVSFYDFLKAVFPSGSVTGAPKIRTMEIIGDLEQHPREVYTGAIGFLGPGKRWKISVPIRTIILEDGQGTFGVGSGIVYDSDPNEEYQECRLKARFLTNPIPEFSLIETMLWDEKIALLDDHLKRLKDSAEYFDYPFFPERVREAVEGLRFDRGKKYKIRLLLDKTGSLSVSHEPLQHDLQSSWIELYPERTDSTDPFLYHKTTNRMLYAQAWQEAKKRGLRDYIFLNEKGEVTEGAITNVFIRKKNAWMTPPVSCGLLNGVYRQYYLHLHRDIEEAVITANDLRSAEEILITNAVQGEITVKLRE